MSGVRDPAFWRRFSMAVHMDEEKASTIASRSTSSLSQKNMKQEDDWLQRTRAKSRRSRSVGWVIVLVLLVLIAGAVVALMWYFQQGPFTKPKPKD